MHNRIIIADSLSSFLTGCLGLLLSLGITISAFAQTGSINSNVPASTLYVGLGGGYHSVDFGTQKVFAVGTSNVDKNGSLASTGSAAGPASILMNSGSTFIPSAQGVTFRILMTAIGYGEQN